MKKSVILCLTLLGQRDRFRADPRAAGGRSDVLGMKGGVNVPARFFIGSNTHPPLMLS